MRVIETSYKGYKFRSRNEARWAVFFDTVGIRYEYEKEGYDLDEAGWYLPDFWLPDQDCWVEIKGDEPTDSERLKAEYLCRVASKTVYIFSGPPWYPIARAAFALTEDGTVADFSYYGAGTSLKNDGYKWPEGPEYSGWQTWLWDYKQDKPIIGCLVEGDDRRAARDERLEKGYLIALHERFDSKSP